MRRIAIASVAVFAAVLAVVTSVELVAGRPLSDLLRGQSGQGTTVFGPSNQAHNTPTPTPSQPSQAAPAVTQTVRPKVVVTTPTVTQTAPPVTKTTTPTVTQSTPPPSTATSPTSPTTPPTSPAPPTA